jgi:four helix bundle protein
MTADEFKQRTKAFAIRCLRLTEALPANATGRAIGAQLLRSGTSVGANYRAACRAKSRADFVNKMRIVEEECDETLYWMELLVDSGQVSAARMRDLMAEGRAILSMVVASAKTARRPTKSSIPNPQSAINRQPSIVNRQLAERV